MIKLINKLIIDIIEPVKNAFGNNFMKPSHQPQSMAVMLGIQSGIVFQTIASSKHLPVLAFSMSVPDYIRRRLSCLVRGF